ncbi:MAG: phosphatidylserine decarboxylase, partial [Clostridia bacterium]|nr:phosphatidylserine decarboxylase [Clostridia bacterium]
MNKSESLFLRFLYKTHIGRIFLKIVSSVKLSKLCEKFWDSSFSKIFIKSFVNKNNININDYYCDEVKNFNEFFSRKIKENLRTVNMDKNVLISPCDGLLSFYKIDKNTVFPIKQSKYSIESLLGGNKKLARKYDDGICLVF